jgi:hypothetical protein
MRYLRQILLVPSLIGAKLYRRHVAPITKPIPSAMASVA